MSAVLWIAVEPKTDADREKLARGLAALAARDPRIAVETDAMTGETIIGGTCDWHLDAIVDCLKREFGVEAHVGRPQVAHKWQETRGDMRTIEALVPLAELFGYSHDLRSRTRGRGNVVVEFAAYKPCPWPDGGDRDSHVGAPRERPPTLGRPAIALPEPDTDEPAG